MAIFVVIATQNTEYLYSASRKQIKHATCNAPAVVSVKTATRHTRGVLDRKRLRDAKV